MSETAVSQVKPVLSIQDVDVRLYSARRTFMDSSGAPLLKGVSVDVPKGKSLAVLGKNGAGNSVFCRLAVGAILPSRGQVVFNGKRRLMLALGGLTHGNLTVGEQIKVLCLWNGLRGKAITRAFDHIIEFSELEHAVRQSVSTLSDGQRARLLFSAGLEFDIDLLIIDEALGAGDIEFRRKSSHLIPDYLKNGGTAVIVSHNVNTLRSFCDHALYLQKGVGTFYEDLGEAIEQYQHDLQIPSVEEGDEHTIEVAQKAENSRARAIALEAALNGIDSAAALFGIPAEQVRLALSQADEKSLANRIDYEVMLRHRLFATPADQG